MGSRNRILDPFGGLLSPQRLLNHHFGAEALVMLLGETFGAVVEGWTANA